jgi:hypothetical protein
MPIEELPVFCYYDIQRFTQFGSMDCANWYGVAVEAGKKKQAMYPAMGRKHVTFLNENKLIFNQEPRAVFKTINYFYVIDGTTVYAYDRNFNQQIIGSIALTGNVWFAFLPVGNLVYAMMTDEKNIYVITENGTSVTMGTVTDPNAPGGSSTGGSPLYVAAFGNRFVVSVGGTPNYYLSRVNLFSTVPDAGTLANCFTINGSPLFNRASGIVQQMGVLHSQLYIFTDFTTDIWANIITQITVNGVTSEFPFKLNSSYNWDYGIADPFSLSIDFGRMVWLGKNATGLVTFMASNGQQPDPISSQAINVLLEKGVSNPGLSPFLEETSIGFLYQWENTIFYRVSAGAYMDYGLLDVENSANSIEYNFDTGKWGRVIELNGERNRIKDHIYFNNTHLVTVSGDPAMYEMAGNIYYNELRNIGTDPQAANAFLKYPMRYEMTTPHLFLPDYSEFIDDYVEIDFVFGDQTFYQSNAPFLNTVFIVGEDSTPDVPVFMVTEDGNDFIIQEGTNTPTFDDNHYNMLFKPHIELYYSDDGGITFVTADLREFSPLGAYRWRMRWYELGVSRNRCYKLICVSSAPIVILGGVRNTRRVSGGAN